MQSHWRHLAAFAAFAVALAGCGKASNSTSPTPTNTDIADATLGVAASPSLLADDLFDVTAATGASARPAGPMAAIDPLSFYRWFSSGTRNFTFVFSNNDSSGRPMSADVTVRRNLFGMLHIVKRAPGDAAPDTHNVVHKVIDDVWTRHLHLVREPADGPASLASHWRVESASGVRIASAPGDRRISLVHLVGSGLDFTVTDPAQLMTLVGLPRVLLNDSVTVTVTTDAIDDVVLLYWHDHRERMHANGDGTFTIKVGVGSGLGLRGVGVNALSHGTLYDDAAPYNSLGWIVPVWVGDAPPSVWP